MMIMSQFANVCKYPCNCNTLTVKKKSRHRCRLFLQLSTDWLVLFVEVNAVLTACAADLIFIIGVEVQNFF